MNIELRPGGRNFSLHLRVFAALAAAIACTPAGVADAQSALIDAHGATGSKNGGHGPHSKIGKKIAVADDPRNSFNNCDGYGAPVGGGDGMTGAGRANIRLFMPSTEANSSRDDLVGPNAWWAKACDQALADSRLRPEMWVRRVNLLRARAIHSLYAGDADAALSDIDRAVASAVRPDDFFYRRSIGVGLDLVRAYTLRKKGDNDQAFLFAQRAIKERPFNRSVLIAAAVALGSARGMIGDKSIGQYLSRVIPTFNEGGPDRVPDDLRLLYASLPQAEAGDRVAVYKASSKVAEFLWGRVNGFSIKDVADGSVTVKFTGRNSSAALVEELALLRAADLARERGKTGFVIKSRKDYDRLLSVISSYGISSGPRADGYMTEINIELVDLSSLPESYRSTPWRVIAVDETLEKLSPIYSRNDTPN